MTQHTTDHHKTTPSTFSQDVDRMRFALNAAGIGVWELNVETNKVIWDDRCRELFGLSKDNALPYQEAIRYIHKEDVEDVNNKVQAALRGESGGHYDCTYRTIGADQLVE